MPPGNGGIGGMPRPPGAVGFVRTKGGETREETYEESCLGA